MIPDVYSNQIAATRKKKSYSFDSISTINEQVETPKQKSIEAIPGNNIFFLIIKKIKLIFFKFI